MLSFNNKQNVQPLYGYLETDLDSFDDQPVDYSKKYSDQESYDDCRRRKSVLKTDQFLPEEPQTAKQSSNDEIKVYCIEGTPLTISYASSLTDLRDIGTSDNTEKPDIKHSFPSINDDASSELFDVDIKKDVELPDSKEESPISRGKEDIKEGKSVSFRNSTDISKASSPLMFSRSSSIASLNSFEQQSIVDDRSSVSVFSALTSGLISPSDLPDSPGDMSPALTDKDSSPKIDVKKNYTNNDCDNIELEEKDDAFQIQETSDNVEDQTSAHIELSNNKVFIPLDSDRISEDNEILVQLETSNDSLDIDEVFDDPEIENETFNLQSEGLREQLSKSDDEWDGDDILLQQCIQMGMHTISKESKCLPSKNVEYSLHSQSPETVKNKDMVLLDENLMPDQTTVLLSHEELELSKDSLTESDVSSNKELELKTADVLKSDDDSDDELLQRCIEMGMPKSTLSDRVKSNSEEFLESSYPLHPVNHKSDKLELKTADDLKSDDDSDEDDELLQRCIQLGMPENMPSGIEAIDENLLVQKYSPEHISYNSEKVQMRTKPHLHFNKNSNVPVSSIQYGLPHMLNDKRDVNTKLMNVKQHSHVKKMCKRTIPGKLYSVEISNDFDDDDDDDPLLQHCTQMGMSKRPEKKVPHTEGFRKPEFDSSRFVSPSTNYRDNCPDGTSDGDDDEDDDILEKCIRAGMPSPETAASNPGRFITNQNTLTCHKPQVSNRALIPESSSDPCKKYSCVRLPQNQPYASVHSGTAWISNTSVMDVDSMRVYQTEDTPILSPTASISDLSSLSINESFLNNSRNSDCSSDSDEDDELLLQCIRSGMPEAKRAVA